MSKRNPHPVGELPAGRSRCLLARRERIAAIRFTGVPGIAIGDDNLRHVHELFPFGSRPPKPDIDAVVWSPDGKQLAFSVHNVNGTHYRPIGGRAVFVIDTDGNGLRRVTPWRLNAGGLGELDWSPDGSRILFHSIAQFSDDPYLSTGDLYAIRPDGTGLRRLTHFPAGTGVQLGSYSPDGTQIVFATTNDATTGYRTAFPDVFVMRADGTGSEPVTRTRNWEGTPSWRSS